MNKKRVHISGARVGKMQRLKKAIQNIADRYGLPTNRVLSSYESATYNTAAQDADTIASTMSAIE